MKNYRIHYYKLFLIVLSMCPAFVQAQQQIPLGTWRTHFSYQHARYAAVAGQQIFCATPNSLFYYDTEDQSLNSLSKGDGLSDAFFSTLSWNPAGQELWIGYANGKIDVLRDQTFHPVTIIHDSEVTESKTIRHISFYQDYAYVSTAFGVVVFDRETFEARETYANLGPAGEPVAAQASLASRDTLFLATETGLMAAPLSLGLNLMDYSNWHRFELPAGYEGMSFDQLVENEGVLYASSENFLFEYQGSWQMIYEFTQPIIAMSASKGKLWITSGKKLFAYTSGTPSEINLPEGSEPMMAIQDTNGHLWIADAQQGLLSDFQGFFKGIYPNGPMSNRITKLYTYQEDKLIALHEQAGGFSYLTEGMWKHITAKESPLFEGNKIYDVTYDPFTGKVYFTVAGQGLVEWDGQESFEKIVFPDAEGQEFFNVTVDEKGELWVLAEGTQNNLKNFNGTANPLSFSAGVLLNSPVHSFISDGYGHLWFTYTNGYGATISLGVIDTETMSTRLLDKGASVSIGMPSDNVFDLALDYDGQLWFGYDNGSALLPFPYEIFDIADYTVIRPIFDGYTLLRDHEVHTIKVDGANRKWMGTHEGAWLLDEVGETSVAFFDTENSLLPSNTLTDIEIINATGEVFFATDLGIVAYRGDAMRGMEVHHLVKAFPNPVPPGFEGLVGISGLANMAEVRITDSAGNLVRELKAAGSLASWDLKDHYGQEVNTGIYLIFSISADGEDAYAGKIAVVR